MLGKYDNIEEDIDEDDEFSNLFGGISGKMLNKMLGGALKMLEKEMQREIKNQERQVKTNFELYINGKKVDPSNIKVTKRPFPQGTSVKKKLSSKDLPRGELKDFRKFPRKEPLTNIRRLSNRVVYEIELPGVKSIKEISIIPLESSIEIKAISKDQSYFKIIPLNFPITDYNFSKEKLVLEFEAKN